MKKEESDAILKLLYDHIALGSDFHVRVRWQPKTVVVFDVSDQVSVQGHTGPHTDDIQNRVVNHSGLLDWLDVSLSTLKQTLTC